MELKTFIERIKTVKAKNSLLDLTYSILELEETINESAVLKKEIDHIGEVVKDAFIVLVENKFEINDSVKLDWDLDNWKNNIKKYSLKNKVKVDTYLYTLRNSLKNIIKNAESKDVYLLKVFLFELIIKTFLYIDFRNLSIDVILENQLKSIPLPVAAPKVIEKKEEKEA